MGEIPWSCVGFIHLGSLMRLRGVVGNGLTGITGAGGNLSHRLFSWLLRSSCTITKVGLRQAGFFFVYYC